MADFSATQFSIDSALELVADHWSAQTPDSVLFRGASLADRVNLSAGLLSGTSPVTIVSIEQGVIDEYQVRITPKNIIGSVRGRDPSAAILDSFVDLGFARPPTAANQDQAFTEILPGFNPATVLTPVDNVGRSTAREIAQKAVEKVGRTLQWEVRDYELFDNFQASGRVVDILRRLIEPWTLLEPFKADIYLQGTTVIIRHRQLPGQPLVASAENTLTIAATRRGQVTVRKRPFKKLGKVTLRGRGQPEGLSVDPNTGLFVSGTVTIERVTEAFTQVGAPPPPGETEPLPAGILVQRTVILDTFRVPDRISLSTVKTTYTKGETGPLVMTARETLENVWETSIYDGGGVINSPKQFGQSIRREILDTEDRIFREDALEIRTLDYDDVGFLTGDTTITRQFNKETDQLELTKMVVKTIHDVGPLISERIVETYAFDQDNLLWIIQSRESEYGGGHRPGGPGRGFGISGIPKGGGDQAFDEVVLERIFSTDPDAQPVEYSNENLTEEDLQFIMDQFEAVQGLFEYEFTFEGVAMPWLRRGTAFKFVGIQAEDGSEFSLPTALITEVTSTYDESSPRAKYTMHCRAFGWQ